MFGPLPEGSTTPGPLDPDFYTKSPYPFNFGIENDDIRPENTCFWDVY
jgi:hypothetical protein